MNILIVGNVLKDVYLNLDSRTEHFETDKNGTKWLDLSFDASEHRYFNRNSNYGGAAISFEVLSKLGLESTVSGSNIQFNDDGLVASDPVKAYRYLLIVDGGVTYFTPTTHQITTFTPPAESYDYLYIDRSAHIDSNTANKIIAYLEISTKTKLVIYLQNFDNPHLVSLIPRANLIFCEKSSKSNSNRDISADSQAPASESTPSLDPTKTIYFSDDSLSFQEITEYVSMNRIDLLSHLTAYSIASATVLGSFILGYSVEQSLNLAQINVEYSKLNSTIPLSRLQELAEKPENKNDIELIAATLVAPGKGILAADESGGSIHKKFAQLNIDDTYDNRHDYRNIFFTTDGLEDYINGVILFDETARDSTDNGQTVVKYLTSKRIIPGIKVDQGLEKFPNSEETYTKGLNGLSTRLQEYYQMGLRFAKWRAAFEIRLDDNGKILTPTDHAIEENCKILAEYAARCQAANIVPIVEPEIVYDGYYSIDQAALTASRIFDTLFNKLDEYKVNLRACILKCSMVLAGKQYETKSTPEEIGARTAEILKDHVPAELAGVVFLSGGQTPEQATDNLAAVTSHGPFPWPVTFSFARALQDPALYAWKGDNTNADTARSAFKERLIANCEALKEHPDKKAK